MPSFLFCFVLLYFVVIGVVFLVIIITNFRCRRAVKAVAVLELFFKVSGEKSTIQYLNIFEVSQI